MNTIQLTFEFMAGWSPTGAWEVSLGNTVVALWSRDVGFTWEDSLWTSEPDRERQIAEAITAEAARLDAQMLGAA